MIDRSTNKNPDIPDSTYTPVDRGSDQHGESENSADVAARAYQNLFAAIWPSKQETTTPGDQTRANTSVGDSSKPFFTAVDTTGDLFAGKPTANLFETGTRLASSLFSGFAFDNIGQTITNGLAVAGAGAYRDYFGTNGPRKNDGDFKFDGSTDKNFFGRVERGLTNFINNPLDSVTDFLVGGPSTRIGDRRSDPATAEVPPERNQAQSAAPTDSWLTSLIGNAVTTTKDSVSALLGDVTIDFSSLFNTDTGSEGTDISISRSGDQLTGAVKRGEITKDADGTVHYKNERQGEGITADITRTEGRFHVEGTDVRQSRNDGDTHSVNVSATTKDGAELQFSQTPDGTATVGNSQSDFTIKREGQAFTLLDKSNNPVMKFTHEGELVQFLKNSTLTVTKPGESLVEATERIRSQRSEADKNKPILAVDSTTGTSLATDGSGNTLLRSPDGTVLLTYKKTDEAGVEQNVQVKVEPGQNGNRVSVSFNNGEFQDLRNLSEEQRRNLSTIAGHDLIWQGHRLCRRCHSHKPESKQVGDETPDSAPLATQQTNEPQYSPLDTDDRTISVAPGITVDRRTGEIAITETSPEGTRTVTVNPQTEAGSTVISDRVGDRTRTTTRFADGSIVSADPNNPQDTITFDVPTRTVHAWDMVMSPERTQIVDRHNHRTTIDPDGNFDIEQFDPTKNTWTTLISSHDDQVRLFDGTLIDEDGNVLYDFEQAEEEFQEQQKELAEARATYLAQCAIDSILSMLASAQVMSPGTLGSLRGQVAEARALCAIYGIPEPAQIAQAESRINSATPQLNEDLRTQQIILAQVGTINPELAMQARRSGLNPYDAARYAERIAGFKPKTENT